jgi:hypothetical protein
MTQTHELDCSDGAKMLIERMQTNPEDFNYGGKLYRALDAERVSARDMKAYNDAHDRYIKEPALMATVLQALLAQPEEEEIGMTKFKTQERYAMNQIKPFGAASIKGEEVSDAYVLNRLYNNALGRERIERDN